MADEGPEIEITPAMIEAGVDALIRRSGMEDGGDLATLRETARSVLFAALHQHLASKQEAS